MRRLIAGLLLVPLLASAQPRPRTIFTSVDMEGYAGAQRDRIEPHDLRVQLTWFSDADVASRFGPSVHGVMAGL